MVTLFDIFHVRKLQRYEEIDFIKALAISAVIMLHTIPEIMLFNLYAPFHFWHAVPIFMVIAGINGTLSIGFLAPFTLQNEYSYKKLIKYFKRIIVPFSVIWIIEIAVSLFTKKTIGPKSIVTSFIMGGMGPGSFFTPVYLQHLMVFPLIYWSINKLKEKKNNQSITLAFALSVSLFFEWACVMLKIPDWLYRLIYIRYFFAVFIGAYLVTYRPKDIFFLVLVFLSSVYIMGTSYLTWNSTVIYPSWGFQHAPAYFYTAFLIILLWKIYPLIGHIGKISQVFANIGKASYHIFLVQMVYFWKFSGLVVHIIGNNLIYGLITNLIICLLFGYLFFNIQALLTDNIEIIFANKSLKRDAA